MRVRPRSSMFVLVVLACGGCSPGAAGLDPRLRLEFSGPGRLAVIWHLGEPDDPPDRHLVVYGEAGALRVDVADPLEVRWLDAEHLLVAQNVPAEALDELPTSRLLRVSLRGGDAAPLGEPRRYYNAEPARDGLQFAVGVETNDRGDSDLEIWSLEAAEPRRARRRAQNLEEPRWGPDGESLLVARMVGPDDEDDSGLAVGGVWVPWPRLFLLEATLEGALLGIHDGERRGPPVAGGSLPLWWDERGVHARQRGGLVRCASPTSGCAPEFEPPEGRRLVDARPLADHRAVLLMVDAQTALLHPLPSEIWLADLETGSGRVLHPARPAVHPLDLDWIRTGAE